jgi:hypothetical protein
LHNGKTLLGRWILRGRPRPLSRNGAVRAEVALLASVLGASIREVLEGRRLVLRCVVGYGRGKRRCDSTLLLAHNAPLRRAWEAPPRILTRTCWRVLRVDTITTTTLRPCTRTIVKVPIRRHARRSRSGARRRRGRGARARGGRTAPAGTPAPRWLPPRRPLAMRT